MLNSSFLVYSLMDFFFPHVHAIGILLKKKNNNTNYIQYIYLEKGY